MLVFFLYYKSSAIALQLKWILLVIGAPKSSVQPTNPVKPNITSALKPALKQPLALSSSASAMQPPETRDCIVVIGIINQKLRRPSASSSGEYVTRYSNKLILISVALKPSLISHIRSPVIARAWKVLVCWFLPLSSFLFGFIAMRSHQILKLIHSAHSK